MEDHQTAVVNMTADDSVDVVVSTDDGIHEVIVSCCRQNCFVSPGVAASTGGILTETRLPRTNFLRSPASTLNLILTDWIASTAATARRANHDRFRAVEDAAR